MKKIAIIGLGNRGKIYLGNAHRQGAQVVALCDKNSKILNSLKAKYKIDDSMAFTDEDAFFNAGKLADAIIIATPDADHYRHCIKAIENNYDILCEKPVSPRYEECKEIDDKVKEKNLLMMVCHVLRYTVYYDAIKKVVDSGEIGEIVSINQIENIGYWHYSHSYVRGNWRNEAESGPSILAKCCHDLDLIYYITGKKALRVSSIGSRKTFIPENKPEGAPKYCLEGCPIEKECPYHVRKIYLAPTRHSFPYMFVRRSLIVGRYGASKKEFVEALKTSPYGRCVYQCDNDVMENQIVKLELEDGVNASLAMASQTNMCFRITRISGTKGEIYGEDHKSRFKVKVFAGKKRTVRFTPLNVLSHLGGDAGVIKDFLQLLETRKATPRLSLMSETMESHRNAFAAEKSRKTGQTIEIEKEYK